MGSLNLPPSGSVYIDTQAVIYSIETQAPYWQLLEPLWQASQSGGLTVISSELTLMETTVKPLRLNDRKMLYAYEQLFRSPDVLLVPIGRETLREGARLRAAVPSLRTPDALHAATARLHGCAQFITNDLGFRQVPDLPAVILRDLL